MNNNKIKLYIVDPNPNFIDTIEGVFFDKTDLGISVVGSATNTSNFEKDKQKIAQSDIYLISANLPDGTGLKVVEFIRKNSVTKAKPIIFTIDTQTRNHASVAKEKGVNKIFQKPFSIKDLISAIYTLTDTPFGNPSLAKQPQPSASSEEPRIPIRKNLQEEHNQPNEANGPSNHTFATNDDEDGPFRKVPNKPELQKEVDSPSPSIPLPVKKKVTTEDLFSKIENNPLLNTNEVAVAPSKVDAPTKTIVTFSSVGSTGKTSMMVNVAMAIQKYAKNNPKICIVDLNLLFPSAQFHFLMSEMKLAQKDIYDLSADLNYLNEDLIRSALHLHQPSGIYILNTPPEPEFIHKTGSIESDQLERILVHLRDMFDVILIDTSNIITEELVLFPIQFADKNLIMMDPNFSNVVRVNKFFYVLKRLEDSTKEPLLNKTHLVLNRESKNKTLHTETTRDFLYDKKFVVRIPEDPDLLEYTNKGKFLVNGETLSSSAIIDLANFIYPINPTVEKKQFFNFPFLKR
ncbi:response regulator [Bacillus toyonensis]|uniref:response regulator n=1 Tax=Bacillus toyonensis TaxID=155322 RepID=UPI002E1B9E79|nr:response regulator [Bacillus toyonensis]MED2737495.1 response regulator [Bacillus toyonensis]